MTKEKILEKEGSIRVKIETLRKKLNEGRIKYNSNSNDWSYLSSLTFTEKKIQEILEYLDTNP